MYTHTPTVLHAYIHTDVCAFMYICPSVLALARAQIHATAGVSIQQALHKAMTKRDLSYHTCVVYSATPPLQRIEWSTDTSQLAGQDVRRETHMHTPTQNARTQTQTLHTVLTYTHRQTLHIHSNIYTEVYQHKFKCTRELFKSFSSPLPHPVSLLLPLLRFGSNMILPFRRAVPSDITLWVVRKAYTSISHIPNLTSGTAHLL